MATVAKALVFLHVSMNHERVASLGDNGGNFLMLLLLSLARCDCHGMP
jgi:hypothetical protein